MATTTGSKKRRKPSPDSLHITALPDNILADVATFLCKPSRALFAAAMTAPSSSWAIFNRKRRPSAMSRAILSSSTDQWDVLDFEDMENSLAKKLSDDDVGAILACINAANNVKILKLAGCVNITGHGLEPLRGSLVLQQIDLSLAKQHERSVIEPEPSISDEAVLPILDSIVDADGNSLKYLQLPKKWRMNRGAKLDQFLEKYNQLLETRGSKCSECCEALGNNDDSGWIIRKDGSQNCTCYKCLKHFCYDCENEDGKVILVSCSTCEKDFCSDCCQCVLCDKCYGSLCSGCGNIKDCPDCGETFCRDCGPDSKCPCSDGVCCKDCDPNYSQCDNDGCNKAHCNQCQNGKENDVEYCCICQVTFCSECRFLKCSEWWKGSCNGCLKLIAPKLAEELDQKQLEIEDLKSKLEEKNNECRRMT